MNAAEDFSNIDFTNDFGRAAAIRQGRRELARFSAQQVASGRCDKQIGEIVTNLVSNLFYVEHRAMGLEFEEIDEMWEHLILLDPTGYDAYDREARRLLGLGVVDWKHLAYEVGGIALIVLALVVVALVWGRS